MQWAECEKCTTEGCVWGRQFSCFVWASWAKAAKARKARSSRAEPVGFQCFQQPCLNCTPTEILCSTTTHLIAVTEFSWSVKQNQQWKYYFFFSLTRPLPPLFCLSLSHPTGTSTEWWQSLRKVILNYFEGQAVCFWMERRGWIFFRTFMLVYIKSTLHKIECLRKVKELGKS